MKKFSVEQIQERFNSLPEDIKIAITSPEVNASLENIAQSNGLRVDQLGELVDIVGLILLGFIPSGNFVEQLSSVAEIEPLQAKKIADDVNTIIFQKIRSSIQKMEQDHAKDDEATVTTNYSPTENIEPEPTKPPHIADLEKAGGFTIEHENNTFSGIGGEGIGSDTLRATPIRDRWAPVQQTVVPNGTPSIPKTETVVPPKTFTPPIETPKTETITKVDIPKEDQKIEQKSNEPLADQLLSILNKPKETKTDQASTNSSTPPVNLPIEEVKKPDNDTQTKTILEKNEKTEEKPVFNLDSYIKKPEKTTEPTKETVVLKSVPPPIPSNPTKDTKTSVSQPPKTKGPDPYREPIQ